MSMQLRQSFQSKFLQRKSLSSCYMVVIPMLHSENNHSFLSVQDAHHFQNRLKLQVTLLFIIQRDTSVYQTNAYLLLEILLLIDYRIILCKLERVHRYLAHGYLKLLGFTDNPLNE